MEKQFKTLEKLLKKIIKKYKIRSDFVENTFFLEQIVTMDWVEAKEFKYIRNILSTLIENDNYEYFEKIGNSENRVSLDELVKLLIKESKNKGIDIVLENLKNFLINKKIKLYRVYLLGGIHTSSSYKDINFLFANGVKIVNLKNLVNKRIYSIYSNSFFSPKIEMYLIYEHEEEKSKLISKKHDYPNLKRNDYAKFDKKINNVYLSLLLSRHYKWNYIPIIAKTVISSEKDFFISSDGYTTVPYIHSRIQSGLIKIELCKANEILLKFEKLEDKLQNKLSIAIKRISEFSSLYDEVDKLISVRVSMESIFLNDKDKYKLSKKLRERASEFLSNKDIERERIKKIFEDAYSACSNAIHNGKVKDKEFEDVEKVVPYLYDAILNIIYLKKEPSWIIK